MADTYRVNFKSGKHVDLKQCTGYKKKQETFTRKNGNTFRAMAYVFYFGAGKGIVHYQASKVKSVKKR